MTPTTTALTQDDHCRRLAYLSERWAPPALTPKQILRQSVDFGLQSTSADPGEAASGEALRLATEIGIDTPEQDLLALATHIGALANLLAWLLRGDTSPYKRPEAIRMPNGSIWTSGAFLSQNERSLRYVALVDRWDAWTQTALEHSWPIMGECSAYQVPMDVIVVPIGKLRKGRWSNPFTVAYRHPVAKNLRFKKRDGEDFGATWERVERERDSATREEWLDSMTEDGVLAESLYVHHVDVPRQFCAILHNAESKLIRIGQTTEPPEPQYSQCFDRVRLCPFRSACPNGLEPSEELGFLHHAPDVPAHIIG
jgi:hypothetical protein